MEDGRISRDELGVRFSFERHLAHSIDDVWRVLTVPSEIEAAWGGRVEIDLRIGGEYVTHHAGGQKVVDHVVRLEPPRLLEHTFWHDVNPDALVTWELETMSDGCVLRLIHFLSHDDLRSASASLAAGDPIATVLSRNAAGWHRILDRVANHLDGHIDAWTDNDQRALQAHYAKVLPSLGTR